MTKRLTSFERVARAHASSRLSPGTRALYLGDFNRWLAWCRKHKVDPTKPTLEDATAYRDELQEKQDVQSVRRVLSALSSMYGAAVALEDRLATWNPFHPQALPRPPADTYGRTEAIDVEKAKQIVAAADKESDGIGLRDAAILHLLFDTGIRISSLLSMRRSKLVRRGDGVVAWVKVKGTKLREVAIPRECAVVVERWLADAVVPESDFVFPADRGKGAMSRNTVDKMLKARGGAKMSAHRFRATFATGAFDAGVPLQEVQKALHHSSPVTTQRYDRGARGGGVAEALAKFRGK